MHTATAPHDPPKDVPSFWQRLLHRWFVEYNPLYLLSAMLVLGGTILSSRGLASDGSLYGQIGVAAIAEIYSAALIGGAALLLRVGQRRSAVMLALLTGLYQCDLTLHTETCPNLGSLGQVATGFWIALFVAKLFGLAWAMKLRLSRGAVATATLGGVGLALLPYVLQEVNPRGASALVALWLFALSVAHRTATVTCAADLDDWGRIVLGRAVKATWMLWLLLLSLHLLFWSTQYRIDLTSVAPVVPLVLLPWIRREAAVWAVVFATLVLVGVALPGSFAFTAFLAAAALGLRAFTAKHASPIVIQAGGAASVAPYRASAGDDRPPPVQASTSFVVVDPRPEIRRLLVGAGVALYLSLWTLSWSGGPWPAHLLSLDLLVTALALLGMWRERVHLAALPLAAAWGHFVLQARLVPAPRSLVEWGGASIGLGFALLITSLAVSFMLRQRSQAPADRGAVRLDG